MLISDLLTELGDELSEDFTHAAIWTKSELIGYIRTVIREFSTTTGIVDKSLIRVVDGTTGESSVPTDFNSLHYVLFDGKHKDIVTLGELDFIDHDWALNGTSATPVAATLVGTGRNSKVKFVPTPSTVTGSLGSSAITTVYISDSSGGVWRITTDGGAVVSTSSSGTTKEITLSGPTTYWTLSINTSGVLSTATSAAATAGDVIYLEDSSDSDIYSLIATDDGVIKSSAITKGLTVSVKLAGTTQTFTAGTSGTSPEYGVVVDAYATGASTTPTDVIRLDSPRGTGVYDRTFDDSAMLWYKGILDDVVNENSKLWLSDAFIPIIKRGVLAIAYGRDGEGRDEQKAQMLDSIFKSECKALAEIFQRR